MATEKRLIDVSVVLEELKQAEKEMLVVTSLGCKAVDIRAVLQYIKSVPTVDAYTVHEVAEILAEAFGDTCACNFNGNDEWLPEKCELLDACPNTVGVACWEQFLKHRCAKMDGDVDA